MNPDWPGLSLVQKELAKIRKRDAERSPESKGLDRPWSIGTFFEHTMPPEVIPLLLQIQADRREADFTMSVRQARWIAVLRQVIVTSEVVKNLDMDAKKTVIQSVAFAYAMREEISELTGTLLDTSDLDDVLAKGELLLLVGLQGLRDYFNLPPKSAKSPVSSDSEIDQSVQQLHEHLGLVLDLPDFKTEQGDFEYVFWLAIIGCGKKWATLSKVAQRELVKRLQEWVKANEPDFHFKSPPNLLE